MEKYKTIEEAKIEINPPQEVLIKIPEKLNMDGIEEFLRANSKNCKNGKQCFCDGSCKKPITEQEKPRDLYSAQREYNSQNFEEDYWIKLINSLQRYSEVYKRGTGILPNEDGEYVKIEDVLLLFSAQK
jgi:hypothetical protein